MRRKMEKEIQNKEEELECELKRKFAKLEDDKKGEYEFLTENIRKNLKNLEKSNEELNMSLMELQNKFSIEKETNENLTSNIANLQKNLRNLNSQLEEKENLIKNLSDKNFSYEDTMRSFSMTNKSYKLNLDNLVGQIENLEKEIKNLNLTIKEKEGEIITEAELHNKTKSKLHEYENVFENLQNDNNYYITRCNELESNCQKFDRDYEDLISNYNSLKENCDALEKKNLEYAKQIKNLNFEKNNFNDLVIKLIKSKSTSIRNELNSIKAYYNNESSLIKKEYAKTIETLLNKIKIFTLSFERDVENKTKTNKENLEREYKQKMEEKENFLSAEIKKIEQKYEKHILEQFRVNEKLEKENKNLIEAQQNNLLKCKEHTFKHVELESEYKNLNNQLNKFKVENDVLSETIEKLRMEKLNFNKIKLENEENGEMTKRETIRKLQTNLSNVLLFIVKLKKKYNQEILNLKTEIEELSKSYESKISYIIDD